MAEYLALLLAVAAPAVVSAAQGVGLYGQCGGIGYTGSTTCVSGAVCTSYNAYYSQCVPGTAATTSVATTLATSTTKPATSGSCKTRTSTSVASPSGTATGVKYFINFGDSYSQTGFDINSTKPSASNPLGNPPLPGWTASGGLNWVGFLTSEFNTSTLLTYNFAYGGATTDSSLVTPYEPTVLSFVDQVKEFSSSIASHPSYAPWTAANTLVGVWIGVNDVGNSYWFSNETILLEDIMDRYFQQLQIVYDAGARNFVLLSVPPIYETPMMLLESADSRSQEKTVIEEYNFSLASRLAAFKAVNPGVTGVVVDTSVPFNTAIANPTAYGAPNATCYDADGTTCLWFNNYHPGIAINKLVAETVAKAWKGSFF